MKKPDSLMLRGSQSILVIVISSRFPGREAGPTVPAPPVPLPSLGPSTRGLASSPIVSFSIPLRSSVPRLLSLAVSLSFCRSLGLSFSPCVSLWCALWRDLEANKACFFPQPEIHTAALIRSIRHYIAPLGVPHRHTKMER